jgi:hypothetical protein
MSRNKPELEALDQALRNAFRRTELPAAPGSLRADVEALAAATGRSKRGTWRGSQWHRSPVVVTLMAAAAVIALVAVGLPLLRTQPQDGQASPSASHATPTAATAPSISPSPTARPTPGPIASDGSSITDDGPSITWTNVPLAQFGSNRVWAVSAGQVGGTLVVAAIDSTQNDMKPVLIVSTDGTHWSRVPTDSPDFANTRLDLLLPIPDGLLLVGTSTLPDPLCPAAAAGCNQAPSPVFMWHSSDGLTWQRLSAKATALFDRVSIVSMAAGPKGLLAFGIHDPKGTLPVSTDSVVLFSVDGLNWSSRAFPDQNGGTTGVLVQQVVATTDGFIAAGSNDQMPGSSEPSVGGAAWYSSDGLTWTRAKVPTGIAHETRYAAAGKAGMVATSNEVSATSNVLWVSADGKTWQTADTSPFTNGSGWLTGDANQILVISGTRVSWSRDGRTWHRGRSTPAMPDLSVLGVTSMAWIFGSTVIAVSPDDLSLYVGHVAGN